MSYKEVERLRARFITHMSHELRTPLTAVRGSSATLMRRRDSLTEAETLVLTEMLDRQSRHLTKLVNSLIGSLEEDVVSLEAPVLSEALVDRVGARGDEDDAGGADRA